MSLSARPLQARLQTLDTLTWQGCAPQLPVRILVHPLMHVGIRWPSHLQSHQASYQLPRMVVRIHQITGPNPESAIPLGGSLGINVAYCRQPTHASSKVTCEYLDWEICWYWALPISRDHVKGF